VPSGGTSITQPIRALQDGTFPGFVDPGRYDVTITYAGDTEVHRWAALNTQQDSWTTVTGFTNSWTHFTGRTARYRKTSEGFVYLDGALASGTVGSAAFTLPAGFRPASTLVFTVYTFGTIGRVDVSSAGVVTPTTPSSNILVSLGLWFYADG
jgi:hypothetical protein